MKDHHHDDDPEAEFADRVRRVLRHSSDHSHDHDHQAPLADTGAAGVRASKVSRSGWASRLRCRPFAQTVAHDVIHAFPFATEALVHIDPSGDIDAHELTDHHN